MFYGLAETPRLAGGRITLQLALLSPAGRPIAVTADLAGFWAGAWQEVRREMRGRYPKHEWPENPGAP
jgi:ATP-dependent helicase HrpB